jgi:hypothetical protein
VADSQEGAAGCLNILAVWPKYLWDRKQSPSRRFYQRALAAHPDVRMHLTGPGFPDWNDALTGMQNIGCIMPDCHAVLSYKALGGCEYGRVDKPDEVARHVLTIEQFNECWPSTSELGGEIHPGVGSVVDYCRGAHIRLVIIHHENDRPRVAELESDGARVVHIPHAAHPLFAWHAKPWSERSGILLTGSLNREHYPLRCRMHDLIKAGKIPGARYFPRPPNYTNSTDASDALVRDYAEALGSCCVKLGCSSIWGYQLQHYSEAAMAGCAHVADMPDAVGPEFSKMLKSVQPDCTDDELLSAIEAAMHYGEAMGRRAQEVAQRLYTTDIYAERLVSAIRGCLGWNGPADMDIEATERKNGG